MSDASHSAHGNIAPMSRQRLRDCSRTKIALRPLFVRLIRMDTRKTTETPADRPIRPKTRQALMIARWSIALVWAGAVVVLWPAIPRLFATFLLTFLLTNALWQHVPLKRACIMAFALTGLAAIIGELALGTSDFAAVPVLWLVDALGALIGALVSYIAMPLVDRVFNPQR